MRIVLNRGGREPQGRPLFMGTWCSGLALLMLACGGAALPAQQHTDQKPSGATSTTAAPPASAPNLRTPAQDEWKKQSDELLLLATQLKQEVDKTTEDVLSLKVIETAKQIERFTHKTEQQLKAEN